MRTETVDVLRWLERSRAAGSGKPILNHETFWEQGFLVKLFDGPTPAGRRDFHINTSPEFFYQFDGEMRCRLRRDDSRFEDVVVGEGEMFLIPAGVPHLNQRDEGSIGLVIHEARKPGALDAIVWYCEECAGQLHRVDYRFEELQRQLRTFIRDFLSSVELRTCRRCGAVMSADQGFM
jgi:3-hydroxyanthranilate 3,4-dioxygenase